MKYSTHLERKLRLFLFLIGGIFIFNSPSLATTTTLPSTFFPAHLIEGVIEHQADDPTDNSFQIEIKDKIPIHSRAYLVYDLYGIDNHIGVTRSINEQLAIGGYFVKTTTQWSTQKEAIHPAWLKSGNNTIRFTLPHTAKHSYSVRNVGILIEEIPAATNQEQALIITQPDFDYFSNQAYIKGYVKDKKADVAQVLIDGKAVKLFNGAFEYVQNKAVTKQQKAWSTQVKAIFSDGTIHTEQVHFNNPITADYKFPLRALTTSVKTFYSPQQATELALTGAQIHLAANCLDAATPLTLTALRAIDTPPLDAAIINVTNTQRAIRFAPHDLNFKKSATLDLAFDPAKIPQGYSFEDIQTFAYDYELGKWQLLERTAVNMDKLSITSTLNKGGDFINGIIQVPESPEGQSYKPTEIKDIKVADPTAAIQLIPPPVANHRGTADVNYPIRIPNGRQGVQPQLALNYSSGSDNSWCGIGWNLSVPTIAVDTRWGVPRYAAAQETEIYTLNGEQLTMFVTDENGVEKSYLPHRSKFVNRDLDKMEQRFHPRVEGAFQKIIRRGNHPNNFSWEVTDKNGTRYFYGSSSTGTLEPNAILKDANGNIAQWALVEIRDLHDNYVQYDHTVVEDAGVAGSTNLGTQLYCEKITYTGHGTTAGKYSILFTRDRELNEAQRKDIQINARYGFKQVTADLLRRIEVKFNEESIRSYELNYTEGAFFKTLLSSIVELDAAGQVFTTHQLDYYDDVRTGETYLPLGSTENWTPQDDDLKGSFLNPIEQFTDKSSALSGNKSSGGGAGLAVTVGTDDSRYFSKNNTAGASFGFALSNNEGLLASVDINGDGLIDKVFKKDDQLFFRANQSGATGGTTFGEPQPIIGISDFSKGRDITVEVGIESHFGVFLGAQFSHTNGTTSVYFTDANGDDLIDIVKNGQVFFNHLDELGQPNFTTASADTPSPIRANGSINADLVQIDPQELETAIDENPLHDVVKIWEAPYDGTVTITGEVQLMVTTSAADYTNDDGVKVSIQINDNLQWQTTIAADDTLSRTPANVENIALQRGDRIYFRTQSIFDGAFDQVRWSPTVTYVNHLDTLRDANHLPLYQFNAQEDFLLTAPMAMGIPLTGEVKVDGRFKKPITSDDITIEIIQENLDGSRFTLDRRNYAWDSVVDEDFDFPSNTSIFSDNRFEKGVNLFFKVTANTNIDWAGIEWNPRAYYTKSNDSTVRDEQLFDASGEPLLVFYPTVDYTIFNQAVLPTQVWNIVDTVAAIQDSNFIIIEPRLELSANLTDNLTFSVKKQQELLGETSIRVENGTLVAGQSVTIPTVFPLDTLQAIYVEYHTRNTELANAVTKAEAIVTNFNIPTDNFLKDTIPAGLHTINEETAIFGAMYRGWGQFVYNGNRGRADSLIDEMELAIDTSMMNSADLDLSEAETPEEMQAVYAEGGGHDPSTTKFIYMMPDMQTQAWKGYDDLTYVKKAEWSASRLGMDDLVVVSPIMAGENVNDSGATGINKVSETNNISGALGAGPLGGNVSTGITSHVYDYLDMNGDRYPDILSKNNIQYTLPIGGLSEQVTNHAFGIPHRSSHDAAGVALSGTFAKSSSNNNQSSSGGSKASKSEGKATISAGISGNFNANTDQTSFSWMDINGDGLPDRVHHGGEVELNIGYDFLPPEPWEYQGISDGTAIGYGAGLNFNIDNYSLSVGLGMSRSENTTEEILEDMNGDGLLDYVIKETPLRVAINTGNGFAAPILWVGAEKIQDATATGESINGAFTGCIPIKIIGIKICFNPSVSISQGAHRTQTQIRDIDGDGYPDYLESDQDNELKVKRSTIGRTNKLKSIQRPLGSEITVKYERVGNTYAMPNSVWTLSEVEVFDGFVGDGADTLRARFVYEEGYYDRHEREFYGFHKVQTQQLDTEDENRVYRKNIQTFIQDNYYEKGLVQSETLTDGADNKYTETVYEYELKDSKDGSLLPAGFATTVAGTAFPAVKEMQQYFYEGQATAGKAARMLYQYDARGNIIAYEDVGDVEADLSDITPNDNYITRIEYHDIVDKYIVNVAKKIVVQDSNNQTYRHRETSLDSLTGRITQVRKYLDSNTFGVYDLVYDAFGNLTELQRPENHRGERFSLIYTYDPELHIFITTVEDGYGYRNSGTYDYRFGQLLNSIDINGQEIQRSVDNVGRITKIRSPYEIAQGVDYTIQFSYHPTADVPWAWTQHYDPQHPDNPIETVTFTDGLARVLQVKKDAAIFVAPQVADREQRIVSGRVLFDAFGRKTTTYYPQLEELSIEKNAFNSTFDDISPTFTIYDVLDRPTTVVLPDNAITNTDYSFGIDRNNQTQFLIKTTDAEGRIKDKYTNVRGLLTATLDYISDAPEHGDVWTSFTYNAVKERTSIVDDQSHTSTFAYDQYGRRISRDHPDQGLCTYEYDLADNLIAKQTANIRAEDEALAIRYLYDKERLVDIRYPLHPSNNVHYEYGDINVANDSLYNRMGRIKFQADATGSQIFFYDRLGEINKNIRTVSVIRGRPARTFTTRYKYDTWNRITRMVYPDGEVLDYHYNEGGKLRSMASQKLEVDYHYIDQMSYDEFEQKVYCALGNGSSTEYNYEPDRRRLARMLTQTGGSARSIMDNAYTYDKVSNVLNIKNNARIPINDLGGPAEQSFEYDDLYRLTHAEGYWGTFQQVQRYALNMTYDSMHDIVNKFQHHQRSAGEYIDPDVVAPTAVIDWENITEPISDWETSNFTSHNLEYSYHSNQPHTAKQIGIFKYTYDDNGNLSQRQHLVNFGQNRRLYWDEEDRLMSIDDDERVHHYVYDANNIRVIKQKDIGNYVYVNGQLVVGGDSDGQYTIYVNPEMVVSELGYTKHFFVEGQRICSKLGLGGSFGLGGNWGDWDNWTAWESWDNWANNDDWNNWYDNGNWEGEDGVWNSSLNVEERARYFFHTDHLGSTGYITDRHGEVHQHLEYLPFGETFIQEHQLNTSFDRTPYLFNGKELDEETQLYYYGARYYEPNTARWLSVDPLADEYAGWSPYHYTLNNPIKYIDPDGRMAKKAIEPSRFQRLKNKLLFPVKKVQRTVGLTMLGISPKDRVGTRGGARGGKDFTAAGKLKVLEANRAKNAGTLLCDDCGMTLVPAKKSQKGVTPPVNEAQVDHIDPKAKGGDGDPSNGQVLCRTCNRGKTAILPTIYYKQSRFKGWIPWLLRQ